VPSLQLRRWKHPYFRDKKTVRQTDLSARVFSPAIYGVIANVMKQSHTKGSPRFARDARSPPDGLLTSLPDFQRNYHGNKDAYFSYKEFEEDQSPSLLLVYFVIK
jgi:hypothetical protein